MNRTSGAQRFATSHWNSALMVTAVVLAVALLIAPFAAGESGSGGLGGLSIAAAICLAATWIFESFAALLGASASPLVLMALGMTIRMVPPLGLCVALAARGIHGREHLAFIFYLLGFYLVTLAMETWTGVVRASAPRPQTNPIAS